MHLICDLFRTILQNTTRLEGLCYDVNALSSNEIMKKTEEFKQTLKQNQHTQQTIQSQTPSGTSNNTVIPQSAVANIDSYYEKGAAYYIIVVICFYSLSVIFLLLFNYKFKFIINKNSFHCTHKDAGNDLYELQKEETKTTIQLLFQNSTKLFTTIATHPQTFTHRDSIDDIKRSLSLNTEATALLSINEENGNCAVVLNPAKNADTNVLSVDASDSSNRRVDLIESTI